MTLHVDVVENKWSAGRQRCVARVSLVHGKVEIDGDPHWKELVRGALEPLDETAPPEALLEAVASHFKSDYAHATDPHEAHGCPFRGGAELPFEEQPASPAHAQAAQPAGA